LESSTLPIRRRISARLRGVRKSAGLKYLINNCKLMLKGNAYTVGKIIKLFTGKNPLKVLDMEEPLFEREERPFQKSINSRGKEIAFGDKNRR
jgi:hypothetical protein